MPPLCFLTPKTIYVQLAFSGALWYNYLGKYDALNNKNQQLYRK